MKDLMGLMKQAQAMQEKMKKMQDEAANSEVVGESGAGLSLLHEIVNIEIHGLLH